MSVQLPDEIITNPGINLGHPAFRSLVDKAKLDDAETAAQLLAKIFTPQRVDNISLRIGDPSDVAFVPVSPQSGGKNFLPRRATKFLKASIGGQVTDVLQLLESVGKRQTQGFWERLVTPRRFGILESDISLLRDKIILCLCT